MPEGYQIGMYTRQLIERIRSKIIHSTGAIGKVGGTRPLSIRDKSMGR